MLPSKIQLEVITPARQVLREMAESVVIPGKEGCLGILPGHAPLITELGVGELSYQKDGRAHYLTVMQGFAEVLPDRVIVLAEISERPGEIDVPRAQAAQSRAQQTISRPAPDTDWNVATISLEKAMVRLQVAAKGGFAAGPPDKK